MKTSRFKNILGLSLALMVLLPLLSAQGSAGELAMNPDRHPQPAAMPLGTGTPGDDLQITFGTPDNDRIVQYGRGGNDTQSVSGNSGNDWITQDGGDGNDGQTIFAGTGDDFLRQSGGNGDDSLIYTDCGDGNDWIHQSGGAGNDHMIAYGGYGNDDIYVDGSPGDDTLRIDGGDDDDLMRGNGGSGNDTITYDVRSANDQVYIDSGIGTDALTINANNQNFTVLDEQGHLICQYGAGGTTITVKDIEHLIVMDPDGKPLPCGMQSARSGNDEAGVTNALPTAQSTAAMIAGGGLGSSVAISGDVIVVGAPDRDAAYVFVKPGGGWANTAYIATLTASDNVVGDGFGASVAISGDTIVVGAPFAEIGGNDVQGAAYIFVKPPAGWTGTLTQTAKLTASDGAAGDQFGASVAVSGTTVAVGAPFSAIGSNYAQGAAYVFVNTTQAAKLTASDGAAADAFGASVAVSGDVVSVGAPWHNIGSNADQGGAYIFVKPGGGWATTTQTAKLTASDGATDKFGAELGSAVSISGDTAVAGAWLADVSTNLNQGAAYVFVKPSGGWADMTQTSTLTSSETDADEFGASVAMDGDTIVVGSPIASGGIGAGYVFVKPSGGWAGERTQDARLTSSDAGADGFGASAAISAATIVVGAPTGNSGSGAGYVFIQPGGGWTGNLTQTARLYAPWRLFLPLILR